MVIECQTVDLLSGRGDGMIDAALTAMSNRLTANQRQPGEIGRHRRP